MSQDRDALSQLSNDYANVGAPIETNYLERLGHTAGFAGEQFSPWRQQVELDESNHEIASQIQRFMELKNEYN